MFSDDSVQSEAAADGDRLKAAVCVQFVQDMLDVITHRGHADTEQRCDLAGRVSIGQMTKDHMKLP